MAEYIDKRKAQMALCNLPATLDAEAVQRCIETVHNLPAVDVRERVPVENVMEYRHVKYDHHEFFHHKQTNADGVREMDDAELASWIVSVTDRCPKGRRARTESCKYSGMGGEDFNCIDCWTDWLQQEVDNGKSN